MAAGDHDAVGQRAGGHDEAEQRTGVQVIIISALFLISGLGIGLFASTIANTQQEAMLTTFMTILPTIFLSGFFFPVAAMPQALQWISAVIPLKYFLIIVRSIVLKGAYTVVADPDGHIAKDYRKIARRIADLTPQQFRVLGALCSGQLNKQIAYDLDVSEATVKAHVTAILRKLGVATRTQAVLAAGRLATDRAAVKPPPEEAE